MANDAAELERWLETELVNRPLLDADRIFDDARRVLWVAAFSGKKIAELGRQRGVRHPANLSTAERIAMRLEERGLDKATEQIELWRILLWGVHLPEHRPFQRATRDAVH